MTERLDAKLHRLFSLLVMVLVVVSSFRPLMDNVDLGWHVAQGRWMVQHLAFYRVDAFNYPNLGRPVIDEYPLFQVVLYGAVSLGWWGPCLLTAALYLALIATVLKGGRRLDDTSALPALAFGLMLLFLQVAVPLRPHLITYLGVIILGVFLLLHRESEKWTAFWPMALLQVAWTNCHGGFVLGPLMVAAFGSEVVLRNAIKTRAIPWALLQTWGLAFLLIFLACLINPHGWECFYPPLFQGSLESIRSYVGEMQPLIGPASTLYGALAILAALLVGIAAWRRGAVCWSFLFLALGFYLQAQSVKKAWPVFGLFLPLLILGSAAWSSRPRSKSGIASLLGHGVVLVALAMALYFRVDGISPSSLQVSWREHDRGHTELAQDASRWMRTQGIEGRLFHRCEDGGWLQQEGFTETFADTGFGKYDEAFIHQVGLVGERPALLPGELRAYRPDFVVCGNFCFQWPTYLRQEGWRLIFYSPNSSVWTRPETRPDLPTVTDDQVIDAFSRRLGDEGLPTDTLLYGREIIALHSLGLEEFAFHSLQALPANMHRLPWYWEAVRILCFEWPAASAEHRHQWLDEAIQLHNDPLTTEFRARSSYTDGRIDEALQLLQALPPASLSNDEAELLLKIELDRHRPEALPLARRGNLFDLRNGRHWQYLAQAEEAAGHSAAAAQAWQKAVFYYPDDPDLMANAARFARQHPETSRLIELDRNK